MKLLVYENEEKRRKLKKQYNKYTVVGISAFMDEGDQLNDILGLLQEEQYESFIIDISNLIRDGGYFKIYIERLLRLLERNIEDVHFCIMQSYLDKFIEFCPYLFDRLELDKTFGKMERANEALNERRQISEYECPKRIYVYDKIETVRKCDKRIIPLSELLEKYEGINICYEIDDIEKKLVEKQIEFIDISSLVQILELRKDIVLQAEMLFLRISTIYRGKFCIKRDYLSLLEEKFPYMFLEKILFGKSPETKNEVNIEKKLDASEILRIAEDINNSLKGHDEFKKDFKRDLLKFVFLNNMGERKIFSIIICGQSGIGKTEFAKIVSDKMFPNEELIKINFGNYSTEGVLNSLIGSPLGYVGSEEGGELINKIQKSKSKVILIDEFEKATASVYNFFYELLEDGVFTDRHGIKHDLDGYIIIFTSNMSQETYQKKIPDSLKSRFDMVYYFVNVPGQEKQLFIQNSALELIEKLQIHFGKKVSYESITDELEKLIAYDNLRDIKRKVQDIVFCEFFKIR